MIPRALLMFLVSQLMFGCVDLIATEGPIGAPEKVTLVAGDGVGVIAQQWGVPITTNDDQKILIQAVLYHSGDRPRGQGLVVLNHGDPADTTNRRRWYGTKTLRAAANWFVREGYDVVVPLRAGFARSQGSGQRKSRGCRGVNYEASGNDVADEILKVTRYFQDLDWTNGENVILVGQSWGGIGVVAAAARDPAGVRAVIDFAGITAKNTQTGTLCNRSSAHRAFAKFALTTNIPVLWVFSENDNFNDESEIRAIFHVYSASAPAPAVLSILPPFGQNGHAILGTSGGNRLWAPVVRGFLDDHVRERPEIAQSAEN